MKQFFIHVKTAVFLSIIVMLAPLPSYAEYRVLTSSQRLRYDDPKRMPEFEEAYKKNKKFKYFGIISEDKLGYLKEYGCPDIIGLYNELVVYGSPKPKIEEWIYYAPPKYIYFYKEDGRFWKEKVFTELDKLSIKGKVAIGMDRTQVLRAKGEPGRVLIEHMGQHKGEEKWIYNDVYVYFSSDKVTYFTE